MDRTKTFKDSMCWTNLVIFFSLVNNVVSSPIKHGQSKDGPIYVIGNTTFSCEEVPAEYQGYSFGTLTDNDMMSIFVKNGGSFITNFMAINREQAMKNFKNFQITGGPIKNVKTRERDAQTINSITSDEPCEKINNECGKYVSETDQTKDTQVHETLSEDDLTGTEEVFSCQLRGEPVAGNSAYLRTCSTCQAIRTMPEEYWPRELGEIICKSDDRFCFIDGKIPGGKCNKRTMFIHMLQKRPDTCTLVLKNEQTIKVELWDMIFEEIRIGCECQINKHSCFADFL